MVDEFCHLPCRSDGAVVEITNEKANFFKLKVEAIFSGIAVYEISLFCSFISSPKNTKWQNQPPQRLNGI